MKINIYEVPSCTWVLDGDTFFCTHDEVEIEQYETPYMTVDGVDFYDSEGYVCAECGEPVEGDPAADRAEMDCD